MTKRIAIYATLLSELLSGCKHHAQGIPGQIWSDPVTNGWVTINYTKTFHVQVTPVVEMDVSSTMEPWLDSDLSFGFRLHQADDKWVDFDCDNVADKIIDRDLVPLVEADCSSATDTARAWWKQNGIPHTMTDATGTVWTRE